MALYRGLESPYSFARVLNVVNVLGGAVTSVRSVLRFVYEFAVGDGNDNDGSVKAVCNEEVDHFATFVDNFLYMHPDMCERNSFKSFNYFCCAKGVNFSAVFISKRQDCRLCGRKLTTLPNGKEIVVYHQTRGTYLGTRFTKQCRKCKVQEHYGFFNHAGKRVFNEDCLANEFILSTEDTAIDISLLRYLDEEIVHGALPFQVKANVYNSVHGYSQKNVVECSDRLSDPKLKKTR